MKFRLRRIIIILSLVLAVGTALIAYQQTERYRQTQADFNAANATVEALGTQVIDFFGQEEAARTAIAQAASDEIDRVRSAAATLQAGSLGTRTGLQTQLGSLQATATLDAQNAITQQALATTSAATRDALAERAAQAAIAATEQSAALRAAQQTQEALASDATASANLLATQAAQLVGLRTQVAQAAQATPTPAPQTTAPPATPTMASAQTVSISPRDRRDRFLQDFPQPFTVGADDWSLAAEPQLRVNTDQEASASLLLTNMREERLVISVYFGSDPAQYAMLAGQAATSLALTPIADPPEDFPTPSTFGRNDQAYEAVWSENTVLVRITLLLTEDGEARLVQIARAMLRLLSSV